MELLVVIVGAVMLSVLAIGVGIMFMSGATKSEKELKGESYYE